MSPLPEQPLSPLDGRYSVSVHGLSEHLSEAALNRARVHVEVAWLLYLTDHELFGSTRIDQFLAQDLRAFAANFGPKEIAELALLESNTRHDVKAVEYLVRAKLAELGLTGVAELTHFACTSEDINNLAYAITIGSAVQEVWLPRFVSVISTLKALAVEHRSAAMLAHTHGQPATPTTLGKELAVFVRRLETVHQRIASTRYFGKFSGATGTFAAHVVADAEQDWPAISREFVTSLGLDWNPLTTQIEPHDWQCELYAAISHANRILHNLCTDLWAYISLGYLTQVPEAGATGSSTMPHKINPIRFENAEANLELSSALFESLAQTLVTSRLQRDLTDSTTQRNIGVAFGHSLLALANIEKGLGEFSVNSDRLAADLDDNWEILGEAIQTVIRAEITAGNSSIADPYDLLKGLTRGHKVGKPELLAFIDGLDISISAKAKLRALTPSSYVGLASELVEFIVDP
jgi:adenylosuccinate lyase